MDTETKKDFQKRRSDVWLLLRYHVEGNQEMYPVK